MKTKKRATLLTVVCLMFAAIFFFTSNVKALSGDIYRGVIGVTIGGMNQENTNNDYSLTFDYWAEVFPEYTLLNITIKNDSESNLRAIVQNITCMRDFEVIESTHQIDNIVDFDREGGEISLKGFDVDANSQVNVVIKVKYPTEITTKQYAITFQTVLIDDVEGSGINAQTNFFITPEEPIETVTPEEPKEPENPKETTNQVTPEKTPKTSDTTNIYMLLMAMAIALGSGAIILIKRKEK